jgi:hypothetical protein
MTVSKNQFASFSFNGDFVYVKYNDGIVLDVVIARKMVSDLKVFQQNKIYPYLIDLSGLHYFTQDAREYLSSARTTILSKAAFLCANTRSKMIGTFYLRVNSPIGETQIFSDETDAIIFLRR